MIRVFKAFTSWLGHLSRCVRWQHDYEIYRVGWAGNHHLVCRCRHCGWAK